jgi:hypothetical protein
MASGNSWHSPSHRLRRRWLRVLIFSVASLLASLLISYFSTLIAHAVSARRVSRTLDALEAIRIGDPVSSLEGAVPQCILSQMEERYRCEIFSGWGRWQSLLDHTRCGAWLPIAAVTSPFHSSTGVLSAIACSRQLRERSTVREV